MLLAALILGFAGSLHCVGMCGPIAMMLPLSHDDKRKKAVQLASYHIGRLVTYASLGFLFGLLGRGLFLAGIQQKLSIALGLLMIGVAILPEKKWLSATSRPGLKFVGHVKSALGKRLQDRRLSSLFVLGTLNGLLPCAMVYAALFGAMATQHTASAVFYMIAFGIGTMPLMLSVSFTASMLGMRHRDKFRKVFPVIGLAIGLLLVVRGLGFGTALSPSNLMLFVTDAPRCH